MAYSFPEFPHTNYADTDMAELIALYKTLTGDYKRLLNEIDSLRSTLADYEKNVDSRLDSKVSSSVEPVRNQVISFLNDKFGVKSSELSSQVNQTLTTMQVNINKEQQMFEDELSDSVSERIEQLAENQSRFQETIEAKLNNNIEQLKKQQTSYEQQQNRSMAEYYANLRDYSDTKYKELELRVDNLADLYNSQDLWSNVFSVNGFTAGEWYKYGEISCKDWNDSNITCADFYVNGKELLGYQKYKSLILDPLTGKLDYPENILVNFIMETMPQRITAGEYEDMCLPADTYDKTMLTAKQYDMKGVYNVFK